MWIFVHLKESASATRHLRVTCRQQKTSRSITRQVTILTATTVDGFIAGKNHELDWLYMYTEEQVDGDAGFRAFLDSVDTAIMGMNTYRFSLEQGPIFPGKTNYVFSRTIQNLDDSSVILKSSCSLVDFVRELESKLVGIWIVGGWSLNSQLLDADLVDQLVVSIHPTLIGQGMPLLTFLAKRKNLLLKSHEVFQPGLVHSVYDVIRS